MASPQLYLKIDVKLRLDKMLKFQYPELTITNHLPEGCISAALDYQFLEQKIKVKFTVQFRGRELAYKEFGDKLLERVEEELSDIAKIDAEKKFEGRSLTMTMAAK